MGKGEMMKAKIKIIGLCMLVSLFVALLWPLFDVLLSIIQQFIQLHYINYIVWPPTLKDYLIGYVTAFVILSILFSHYMLRDDEKTRDK